MRGATPFKQLGSRLVLFILASLLFATVQYATDSLIGTDGYYHSKLALLMAQSSILDWPIEFPWLPKTVLSADRYHDHHFLFHVFLAPFVNVSLLDGAKLSAIVAPALMILSFFYAAPRLNFFASCLVVTSFFALSPDFLFRMSMVRAQSLSLAMLFIIFGTLQRNRPALTGLACFIYVWLYNAFPLAILLCLCWVGATFIKERKLPMRQCFATLIGLLAGLVINPYFPKNLIFLFHHLVDKLQLTGYTTAVGNEWYPFSYSGFMANVSLPLAVILVSTLLLLKNKDKISINSLALTLATILMLAMTLKARRFVELFPAFALLTLVTSLCELKLFSKKDATLLMRSFAILALGTMAFFTMRTARGFINDAEKYEQYSQTSTWLKENTPAGALVFNADWDDFPRLFHFNTHNLYLVGLDPYFLYAKDRPGFNLWVKITKGKTQGPIAKLIKTRFESQYIFLDSKHKGLKKNLDKDPNAELVFKGKDSYVYQIVENPKH